MAASKDAKEAKKIRLYFLYLLLQKVPSHSYDLFWQFCQHVDRSIPYLQGENKITNIFLKVKKFLPWILINEKEFSSKVHFEFPPGL